MNKPTFEIWKGRLKSSEHIVYIIFPHGKTDDDFGYVYHHSAANDNFQLPLLKKVLKESILFTERMK